MASAVLLAAGLVGCTGSGGSPLGDPGGLGGFFAVQCAISRVAADDPIVHPGAPDSTHLHDFYGSQVTAFSTPASLSAGPTTCAVGADKAGYWTPSPELNGVPVRPQYQNEYWFDGGFKRVETIPFGFSMVAGNSKATRPPAVNHVWYYCGQSPVNTPRLSSPPDCSLTPSSTQQDVIMVVAFPQCWDGITAADETSHMAYPTAPGACPAGFPHVLPRLEEHIHTGLRSGAGFSLSSGSVITLHGDFMNAWDPAELAQFVDHCINRHIHCPLNSPPPA